MADLESAQSKFSSPLFHTQIVERLVSKLRAECAKPEKDAIWWACRAAYYGSGVYSVRSWEIRTWPPRARCNASDPIDCDEELDAGRRLLAGLRFPLWLSKGCFRTSDWRGACLDALGSGSAKCIKE